MNINIDFVGFISFVLRPFLLIWLFFLKIFSNIKSRYAHRKKLLTYINNFDLLPKKQKEILWELFYHKKLPLKYTAEIRHLLSNNYIEKEEDIEDSKAVYRLHKKMFEFLTKKRENQTKNDLQNLSEIEKEILNLFYDGIEKKQYDAFYSTGIDLLIDKMIIKSDDKKFIEITEYGQKYLKFFRSDIVKKSKVELGKHNILAYCNSGGGSNGGGIVGLSSSRKSKS